MKKKYLYIIVITALLATAIQVFSENIPPPAGSMLPEIDLPVPQNQTHLEYLGLSADGLFQMPQVKTQVLIIVIFSMYCPHCQREAPNINAFYQQIQSDKELKDKVKIIGIGVGNSDFEVNFFRNKYAIPFPLFSDADFTIHKKLGQVRTPYFIGISIAGTKGHTVFYSQLGGPKNSRQMLENLLKSSGLLK